MVQYITTPWRDRRELLDVRRQFYPEKAAADPQPGHAQRHATRPPSRAQRDEQHKAVARVALWMHRGNCPHMVESTALLMAAILGDQDDHHRDSDTAGLDTDGAEPRRVPSSYSSSSNYASRAAYAAAFSRFVTGLLDGQQSRQHKLSMYSLAKTIGLPATFVELRHQSTHEQLPSLARLRAAAGRALEWVWGYYWSHLGDALSGVSGATDVVRCRLAVLGALGEAPNTSRSDLVQAWGKAGVLEALEAIIDSYDIDGGDLSPSAVLAAIRLSKEILSGQREEDPVVDAKSRDLGVVRDSIAQARRDLESELERVPAPREVGPEGYSLNVEWSLCSDDWRSKPIGIV